MTHRVFGSVRASSTESRRKVAITPATKANRPGKRSSALRCHPEKKNTLDTPTPTYPGPLSQHAKKTLSRPKYETHPGIFNAEAAQKKCKLFSPPCLVVFIRQDQMQESDLRSPPLH